MRYEDGYWHKLVLRELKRTIVHGTLHAIGPMPQEPTRYNYLEDAEQEHEALTYLERMKVFQADLGGIDENEPWLFGVDIDVFEKELEKFGLKDVGTELLEKSPLPALAAIEERFGAFTAHKDGSVRYNEKITRLKPQGQRLLHALIMRKGAPLQRDQVVDILWNPDDVKSYLDNPELKRAAITKRIGNVVNEANAILYGLSNKKHIVATGETGYKLLA